MSRWTKRDAFVITEMDKPDFHSTSPIQASFSLWKVGKESKAIADQWLDWCSDRRLITDDANTCGKENLLDYQDHRHDQSLLTLLCLQQGITGLSIGDCKPRFDEKNPADISQLLGKTEAIGGLSMLILKRLSSLAEVMEVIPRKLIKK